MVDQKARHPPSPFSYASFVTAAVILWSADGIEGTAIARRLHVSAEAVSRIRRRARDAPESGGVAGVPDATPRPRVG